MDNQEFHTFRDYMKNVSSELTPSMEDYLEMICRLSKGNGFTRIYELSNALNVQPPSATKMVQKLAELKLLKYERYGIILLEKEGAEIGVLLLKRHSIIETFLRILGIKENQLLEETEKIEHTISDETLHCINSFIKFANDHPAFVVELKEYQKKD